MKVGKCFLRVSTQLYYKWPRYPVLAAELGSVNVTQVVLVLKVRRGHGEQLRLGVAGTESLKRAQERLFVKVQPSCSMGLLHFGDASTMQ